jgi:hypothetical protein
MTDNARIAEVRILHESEFPNLRADANRALPSVAPSSLDVGATVLDEDRLAHPTARESGRQRRGSFALFKVLLE